MEQNVYIKDHYDSIIGEKYEAHYEFNRWFKTPRLALDYSMMYRSIVHHLRDASFSSCIEVGPGPGTWTRLLYRANPEARFDLVDISAAMREQFHLEMREKSNIHYTLKDFLEYETGEQYDFFFSSRAIEYFSDKDGYFQKVKAVLKKGGQGMIITKNPLYGGFWQRDGGRAHHRGNVSLHALKTPIKKHGLFFQAAYPVIARVPLVDRFSFTLSEEVFARTYKRPLAAEPSRLMESYLVVFTA